LPPIISNNDTEDAAAITAPSTSFFDMESSLLATAARIAVAVATSSSTSPPSPSSPLPLQQQRAATATKNANTIGSDEDEDFVVVNDGNRTTTRGSRSTTSVATSGGESSIRRRISSTTATDTTAPSSAIALSHQQQQSTSSAAHTASIPTTASSIVSQSSPSPAHPAAAPVMDNSPTERASSRGRSSSRRNRMIQLWKTASQSRVAHLYKEWFSNCKATAPNLITMDIQPWLMISSHNNNNHNHDDSKKHSLHELAVFDRLPTNAKLLQNYNNGNNNNRTTAHHHHGDVVLPTAKIVGSLAPGMTVVGTAIITFEIILPNNHHSSNNIDCSQQSQAPACLVIANALEAAAASSSSSGASRCEFCQHESYRGSHGHGETGGPLLVPQQGRLQFLQLSSSSPNDNNDGRFHNCFVLYSIHGYTVLGAGLPAVYAQPDVWYWKVTCPVGAYVREGLDLSKLFLLLLLFMFRMVRSCRFVSRWFYCSFGNKV
jgi:hypothetical protein